MRRLPQLDAVVRPDTAAPDPGVTDTAGTP